MITKLKKIALAQTRALPGRFLRPRVVFLTSTDTAATFSSSALVAEYGQALFSDAGWARLKEPHQENPPKFTAVIEEQMGFGAVLVWRSAEQLVREPLILHKIFLSESRRPDALGELRSEHPLHQLMIEDFGKKVLWLCVREQSLEDLRRQLYDLELRGANRHIVHSLRITEASHLPKKRAVAEAWCRLLAKLAASRAALPTIFGNSSLQGREILDASNDTLWQRRARQAILSCYDLQEWLGGSFESAPPWQTLAEEAVFNLKNATKVIGSLGSLRMVVRNSPRVLLRGLPRMATALAVVSFAVDASKEHNALRDFGAALIARAEAEWMRRLANHQAHARHQ